MSALTMRQLETIDHTTNEIVDIIRKKFNFKTNDNDQDDELYSDIHTIIKYRLLNSYKTHDN